ncbi:hypothetical protein E2C01_019213 [Portunus trituberculatus]|uniref:Uncharacterized protein n=1 Tax=Portunus trituberculatus TaxID=210409 RepID=A0A5B7DWM6_PORTR|nr:hypothetical protein [Portunus trituberculatus]
MPFLIPPYDAVFTATNWETTSLNAHDNTRRLNPPQEGTKRLRRHITAACRLPRAATPNTLPHLMSRPVATNKHALPWALLKENVTTANLRSLKGGKQRQFLTALTFT